MILLTKAEAKRVRGRSPRNPRVVIEPTPLRNGLYAVPESVLADPANGDIADWLSQRPSVDRVPKRLFYSGALKSDSMVLRAKNVAMNSGNEVRS